MHTHRVFISYSHRDERWKDLWLTQFEPRVQAGRVDVWHDRRIGPGEVWYDEIREAMASATLSVCLLSPDFLTSDFCTREEVGYLLERRCRDGLRVVPILLRPCRWEGVSWLRALQMLPRDGQAVCEAFAGREHDALARIATDVAAVLDDPSYRPTMTPAPAWPPLDPRCINLDAFAPTGHEVFGRQMPLANLSLAWHNPAVNVLSLVSSMGLGKSALVGKWLQQMADDHFRGAERVFAWSFRPLGPPPHHTPSDEFFASALAWFGDHDPRAGSPWDRAERLADAVRAKRTLLVLDGLDGLQSDLAGEHGRILDPAVATLLLELARDNPGLCVITSRQPVPELQAFGDAAPQEVLERLSAEAGRAILRVEGVAGSDAELEQAALAFGCEAPALALLARYLLGMPGRHVRAAAAIPEAGAGDTHASRVLAAFLRRFDGQPEAQLLRLLGLFSGPASSAEMQALRQEPPIVGLTSQLSLLGEGEWLRLLSGLQAHGLLSFDVQTGRVDAHPLVRQHAARELEAQHPEAWRSGHERLYEHLQQAAEPAPATVHGLLPLVRAMAHARAAGRAKQALLDVVFNRIQRQQADFATVQLGTPGLVLAALAPCFVQPWGEPLPSLAAQHAYLLSQAGECLQRLGRLGEALGLAVRTFQIDSAHRLALSPWSEEAQKAQLAVAQGANTIAEHLLVLGPLDEAGAAALEALKMAHKAGSPFWQVVVLTTIAEAFHRTNQLDRAAENFAYAETLHADIDSRHLPILYARQGHRYCALLNDLGRHDDVIDRAGRAIAVADNWPMNVALDHLSLGQAHLGRGELAKAERHIHAAVEGTRAISDAQVVVASLLARATLRRARGQLAQALADSDRCVHLTTLQGARVAEVDARLLRAGLRVDAGDWERAHQDLLVAREQIAATRYLLREARLHVLERCIGM